MYPGNDGLVLPTRTARRGPTPQRGCPATTEVRYNGRRLTFTLSACHPGGSHERTTERHGQIIGARGQPLRLSILGVGGTGSPEYVEARKPLSELSIGEGKALPIKYREMVIIGILAYRGGNLDGILAHMRRAIQYGATKRELLEAIQSAAVPGGGPTFSAGCRALMQLDGEGAFKNG